jgi:hypothetical protein
MDVAILVLGMFIGGDPPTAKDALMRSGRVN